MRARELAGGGTNAGPTAMRTLRHAAGAITIPARARVAAYVRRDAA